MTLPAIDWITLRNREEVRVLRIRLFLYADFDVEARPADGGEQLAADWLDECGRRLGGRDWEGRRRYGVRRIDVTAPIAPVEVGERFQA